MTQFNKSAYFTYLHNANVCIVFYLEAILVLNTMSQLYIVRMLMFSKNEHKIK